MEKLGPHILAHFRGRVLNTHPALLPKFGGEGMYGLCVHRAVLASGDATTGATVHLVDGEYDNGPILAQSEVAVAAGETPETLARRVQEREQALVVEVLAGIADGRLRLPGGARGDADTAGRKENVRDTDIQGLALRRRHGARRERRASKR